MAFPWVALSWYLKQYTTLVYLDGEDWLRIRTVQTKLQGAELRAGLLVSVIMLLVATWSALLRKQSGQGLASVAEPGVSKLSWVAARSSMLNILVFGLPIYAAMKIGAVIVAMALLLSSASGVPSLLNDGCNIRVTWKSLKRTKFSLLVLSILVVLNALGLDAAVDANSWQGYLALFVSIFILPPSFLTAARNFQIGAKPDLQIVGSATSLSGQQSLSLGTSSIILSPPCTFFTIIFGILLLGVTVLLTLFDGKNAFNMVDLMLGVATATCFALPLISSAPSRLAARPKIGLAAALIFTCLFSALPHPESSRLTYVVWVSVATLSLVAARLDSSKSPTTHAHHSHNHSESELSIVTRYLIRHGESYPLLYSILKEDDSRRIFYFMWYVCRPCSVSKHSANEKASILSSCLCNFRMALSLDHSAFSVIAFICFLTVLRLWLDYALLS
jgi:solute carrier family 30 (zinc transporter), member 5/7